MCNIPPPPEPCSIKEEAIPNIKKWVSYFRELSSRIKVITPEETEFNLDLWQEYAKDLLDDDNQIELVGWPKKDSVVFCVCINCSLSTQALFGGYDFFLFCFNNTDKGKAFGLHYFEETENTFDNVISTYSLENFSEDALSWNYVNSLIVDRLKEIEKIVPKFET